MNTFVHIGFSFAGVPKMLDLEPAIASVSEDWIRYSTNTWILMNPKPLAEIYIALREKIDTEDCILIIPLDLGSCIGRVPDWVWKWLNKNSGGITFGDHATKLIADSVSPKRIK